MIDFLAQTLERWSLQASDLPEFVAVVVPTDAVSPVRLVAAYSGELSTCCFDVASRGDGLALGLAGFGETVRIDGHGTNRLGSVADQARAMFASLQQERGGEGLSAPGPLMVGGLSFRPGSTQEPWSSFADASFTLPRWTYVRRDDKACWWLCVRTDQVKKERAALVREFAALHGTLLQVAQTRPRASPFSASVAQFDVADRDAYCELVAKAIACIRARTADKIVAVASSHVTFHEPVDTRSVLERLDNVYPDTTRFAIARGDRVFVGASPERLVARNGLRVDSDGLAGTARRGRNDAAIVKRLLSSTKERSEHAMVVESIASVLGPHCTALVVPDEPRIRTLRNVHHLWTPIRGVLRDETHILDLVGLLHPTPAVAGTPRDPAVAWIEEHEPHSRGWYTGAVGYFDARGDGEFAVAIRAGLVGKNEAFLYAGAGIIETSDPPAEYAETRAKEAPMLAALGMAP